MISGRDSQQERSEVSQRLVRTFLLSTYNNHA